MALKAGYYGVKKGLLNKLQKLTGIYSLDSETLELSSAGELKVIGGSGTTVVPNPTGEPTDDLNTVKIGSTIYDIPEGTEVVANPQGAATGTLTKLGIGSEIYEIQGGGGSAIDGSTATPTDTISTWLECAGLHQNYTTLNEVLADSGVLYALINSTNAVDYMVRSTTWASSVCANQTAMNYIGNNNYCANTLIANSTWKNALVNSAYADEVFIVVPATTSESTEVGASNYYSDTYAPWKAFDQNLPSGTNFTGWAPLGTGGKVWYHFPEKIKAIKFSIYFISRGATGRYITGKFIGSNDGTNWTDISDSISVECDNIWHYFDSISNTEYEYIGFDVATIDGDATYGIKLQFYGYADLPPVDDRINKKADKTDIAPVENGTTASKAYSAGQQFYLNGSLYKAKTTIAQGAAFTVGTNCELAPSITDQIKALWDAINS